jgi:hypothetical protein
MGVFTSLVGRAVKKAARSAGKALGNAVFGDLDEDDEQKKTAPPDPFAKLKAAEAAKRKER